MERYKEDCRITRSVPNYTCIFLDFVRGFDTYMKDMPKTKQCNSDVVMVSVLFRCICETAQDPKPGIEALTLRLRRKMHIKVTVVCKGRLLLLVTYITGN